jgi:hypothetical protein
MLNLVSLLPHCKKDNKVESKETKGATLNELVELKNCSSCLFFEVFSLIFQCHRVFLVPTTDHVYQLCCCTNVDVYMLLFRRNTLLFVSFKPISSVSFLWWITHLIHLYFMDFCSIHFNFQSIAYLIPAFLCFPFQICFFMYLSSLYNLKSDDWDNILYWISSLGSSFYIGITFLSFRSVYMTFSAGRQKIFISGWQNAPMGRLLNF